MHLIDLNDYEKTVWNELIDLALDIRQNPQNYTGECKGKIMATLFYEPSTRTQMSFQTAMLKLGGGLIGFADADSTSIAKGENLRDTIRIISDYADIIVMRHPEEGSVKAATLYAECPVINAGDGTHLHPTQTLTDLLTLMEEKKTLEGLTIGLCGDLKNGRTVHSLCKALSCYSGNKFVLISEKYLTLPNYIKNIIKSNGCTFETANSLEDAIGKLDVLYMTRIQRERFVNSDDDDNYQHSKDFILNTKKMQLAKPTLAVLHPLPRLNEITAGVDSDERALYFKQASYGVYARTALITYIFRKSPTKPFKCNMFAKEDIKKRVCQNRSCITETEKYLPNYFHNDGKCAYCEKD
jgi:aspartate carbamoyltransferase catalytic subunit